MESGSFLDFYDADDKFLIEAGPITGQPNLVRAERHGSPLLIKFWPLSASIDDDLDGIWLLSCGSCIAVRGYQGVGDYVSFIRTFLSRLSNI